MSENTERLVPTPGQTIGPFYGYALPYEGGEFLVDRSHPNAVRLHGTVYDGHGTPVPVRPVPGSALRHRATSRTKRWHRWTRRKRRRRAVSSSRRACRKAFTGTERPSGVVNPSSAAASSSASSAYTCRYT